MNTHYHGWKLPVLVKHLCPIAGWWHQANAMIDAGEYSLLLSVEPSSRLNDCGTFIFLDRRGVVRKRDILNRVSTDEWFVAVSTGEETDHGDKLTI